MNVKSVTMVGWHERVPALVLKSVWLSLFVAALATSAWIKVPTPFSPVPMTLQTLVVMLAGVTLGVRWGVTAVASYLALGLVGAPAFAGGVGAAAFAGPTAGYLFGFLPGVAASSLGHRRGVVARGAACALALVVIYACGLAYLALVWRMGWAAAWAAGGAPFVLGDVAKGAAVTAGGGAINRAAALLPAGFRRPRP